VTEEIVEPHIGIVIHPGESKDNHERDVQENVRVREHGKDAHLQL